MERSFASPPIASTAALNLASALHPWAFVNWEKPTNARKHNAKLRRSNSLNIPSDRLKLWIKVVITSHLLNPANQLLQSTS
jgi:uncharacterized protein YhjY with autotransporter beta-barrel domain